MRATAQRKYYWIASYLFHFCLLAGLASLAFGLVSCGDNATPANTAPTITSITPAGIVASSVQQTLSILGTNFANGMSLSLSSSSGVPYTISASSVTSATVLTASVTINEAPGDNYATLTIQPATGSAASAILGVAGTSKTVANSIQNIFTTKCAGCHATANASGLDLSDATLGNGTGVIGIQSVACYPKFRVLPGDPRRSSSVLIDRIKAAPAAQFCNANNPMPPAGSTPLTTQEIADIVDWVAGGAN